MIFFKPIGTAEEPVREFDVFSKEIDIAHFAKYPKQIRIGDILIIYGVGVAQIIGIYEIQSEVQEITEEQLKEGYLPRWPWFVTCKNLTPKFSSAHWWDYPEFKLKNLVETHLESNPDSAITAVGTKTINSLRFGKDKLALHPKFANPIVEQILKIEASLKAK